jgi:hypothetical protein
MDGATRILLRAKFVVGVGRIEWTIDITGMLVPLPTVTEEMDGGRHWVSIPAEDVMCVEAPKSTIQSPCNSMFCRAAMRPAASQVLVEVLEPLEEVWSGVKAVLACGEGPSILGLRPASALGPPGAPELP